MYFPSSSIVTLIETQQKEQQLSLFLQGHPSPPPATASTASCSSLPPQPKRTCLKSVSAQKAHTKFVHFGTDLEQTRWFYKSESPKHAACDPKFPDNEKDQKRLVAIHPPTPSFSPYEQSSVVLESVGYKSSKSLLYGTVKVHNLAFEKSVLVRMTLDNWKTVSDTPATFLRTLTPVDGTRPGVDRFKFTIACSDTSVAATHISMCVCYRAGGNEYWDNNMGSNYIFSLKTNATQAAVSSFNTAAARRLDTPALKSSFSASTSASHGVQPTALSQNISCISTDDAKRYMEFSEAKFSDSVGSSNSTTTTQNLPIFSASLWTSASAITNDFDDDFDAGSYYSNIWRSSNSPATYSSSPSRSCSPLWAASPTTTTTLLHC